MSDPRTSRAIVVIGMHRSGTSAVAAGLSAVGVYLGSNFLEAQPENPTGYWEDKAIVELDERVLRALKLTWDDATPIERSRFGGWRIWRLRREAKRYLHRCFRREPLWGFKDPRTIRLLPFWRIVLRDCGVDDAYLLVIRNPSSVAASLYARQAMGVEKAYRLWLVHLLPFLDELTEKPLVVVDYDLLMLDPRAQLERIAGKLGIPSTNRTAGIDHFVSDFIDAKLRHTLFSQSAIDTTTMTGRLTRDAYVLLYELAQNRKEPDGAFWLSWRELKASFSGSRTTDVERSSRGQA